MPQNKSNPYDKLKGSNGKIAPTIDTKETPAQTPEQFQDAIQKIANQQIKQTMQDVKDFIASLDRFNKSYIDAKGDPDALKGLKLPNATNDRQRLARLLWHFDADPLALTIAKIQAFHAFVKPNIPDSFYGIPATNFHDSVEFYPQIELKFQETIAQQNRAGRKYRVRSDINIRWRLQPSEIEGAGFEGIQKSMARKIKSEFGGYKLERGVLKCSYYDKQKNYFLSYFARSESSAKEFFTKLLRLQGDSFESENFTVAERKKNFSQQEYVRISGKQVRVPRKRPIAECRFIGAFVKIHGIIEPRCLVDAGCGGLNPIEFYPGN
jgi:hypothetical protein